MIPESNYPGYQKVLVCLDTSPRAPYVLASAVDIARRYGAELILFRSVGIPLDLPPEALVRRPSELPQLLMDQAAASLSTLTNDLPPGIKARTLVELGVPWEAICRSARAEGVDLVVLGAHGFSGMDHLLGTTAAKVVNHIDRPTLIVRQRGAAS